MKSKKILIITGIILFAIVIVMIISAFICSYSLKVTEYELEIDGITSDIKAVCISDLHNKEYGKNNEDLIALINAQKPNVIFTVGDIIDDNADDDDIQALTKFLDKLVAIAPVYFSVGNNEMNYMSKKGGNLSTEIEKTGAVFLLDNYTEAEIAGNIIRIGGTIGHYRNINWEKKYDYLMEYCIGRTDTPSIVLGHMPESLVFDSVSRTWNYDLYISGHTHGGLWRFPIVGGIIAPTQGFFPKYDQGQFLINDRINLIITSGLSGHGIIPRIFNKPEICVITITTTEL